MTNQTMYIDTHCQLQFSNFDEDRPMVIGNAKKAGVKKFICPGVDLLTSKRAVELARQHPGVIFAAIGFHPYEAQKNPEINNLYNIYSDYKRYIVAIGECGLDYHIYGSEKAQGKKDAQKRLFEEQLDLAIKHNLPVIMHCRDAFEDLFDVLEGLSRVPPGVIHCFSGGLSDVRMSQKRKLFIGIDGNVTYSKHLQTIVPHIPLSMVLLETDAPYLTPVPHRGKRNEPKYIPLIAKEIVKLQGVPVQTVENTTTKNARILFGDML